LTATPFGACCSGQGTKQGSRLVRWAAIESVRILPDTTRIGAIREQVAHRHLHL
jgi:hypothetical protein